MRTILTAMILTVTLGLLGQVQVQLHEGDHLYFLENNYSTPVHYQLCAANKQQIIDEYLELSAEGVPKCEVFFDPGNFENITLRKEEDGTVYVQAVTDKINQSIRAINNDPDSQPIFKDGKLILSHDRYLVISTPHLTRATSFKLCTNNRVFVFVQQHSESAKL